MIGVLYICTGKYNIFWKDFYISAEKFLLPSEQKVYFVFTDAEKIYAEGNKNVKKISQRYLGWPYNTLLRFEIFLKVESKLRNCDYLFFFNANTRFIASVDDEILPGKTNNGLAAVIHPGFWNANRDDFTYERNAGSTAFIDFGNGEYYFMGALNGGESNAYLEMINILKDNIDKDLQNGIIALWWDESHLNHYLLDKNPLALSPSYCYPEDYRIPFTPKLIILNKLKYGGHNFLRGLD